MKTSLTELAGKIPEKSVPKPAGEFAFLNQVNEVVKGINEMIQGYKEITGKAAPIAALTAPNFEDARAAKKAEMKGEKVENNDMVKEVITGLRKTCVQLAAMGYGNRPIGELITAAPFTVEQVAGFLDKLYNKYCGG